MKKKKLFILFLSILIFAGVTTGFALGEGESTNQVPRNQPIRHYIGDEKPDEFALGLGENSGDAIGRNLSILPGVFPEEEELRNQLNWIRYPLNNYYYQTASSKDKGFFQNKMRRGAVVTDLLATALWLFKVFYIRKTLF